MGREISSIIIWISVTIILIIIILASAFLYGWNRGKIFNNQEKEEATSPCTLKSDGGSYSCYTFQNRGKLNEKLINTPSLYMCKEDAIHISDLINSDPLAKQTNVTMECI